MTAPVNGGAPPAVSSVIRASVFNHDPQRQHFQNVVNHCHLNYSVPIYAEGKMQHMLIVEARKRLRFNHIYHILEPVGCLFFYLFKDKAFNILILTRTTTLLLQESG